MLKRARRWCARAIAVGTVLSLLGCTANEPSERRGPQPRSGITSPAAPARATPSVSPQVVFGPESVRIQSVEDKGDAGAQLTLVGPEGARYSVVSKTGTAVNCSQEDGARLPRAPSGLPANSIQPSDLRCDASITPGDLQGGRILVSLQLDAFRYDFQVPIQYQISGDRA